MSGVLARHLLAAATTGLAAAAAASLLVPPTQRLANRVRPYTLAARVSLGRPVDLLARPGTEAVLSGSTLRGLLAPMITRPAAALGRLVDGGRDDALLLRLRQAGLLGGVPEERRAAEYRARQLGSAVLFTVLFAAALLVLGRSPATVLFGALLGFVVGVTRWRGRVDRAIEERRLRMRIELYTVNQLLAIHVRCGGGVVPALQSIAQRGRGELVDEVRELLALHRGGRPMTEALEQAARTTPEPHAARTYRLLAGGVEYGADLAEGLRALSEDIRGQRVEALRRAGTKRRAAMLVPIIAILAPVMLLFVAAPLPSIVLGGR